MKIIKMKALHMQLLRYPEVREPLQAWIDDAKQQQWRSPQDVKARHPSASILADNRIVFNIKGNAYRLIVAAFYPAGFLYVKFFGTHAEYDRVDALTVDDFSDI